MWDIPLLPPKIRFGAKTLLVGAKGFVGSSCEVKIAARLHRLLSVEECYTLDIQALCFCMYIRKAIVNCSGLVLCLHVARIFLYLYRLVSCA